MAPLLIYSQDVSPVARDALRAAYAAGPERRAEMLQSAARVLYDETDLDCRDVRELVGLPEDGAGCGCG